MKIRYFTYATKDDDIDVFEVTENQFLELAGRSGPYRTNDVTIQYERHTVAENGVSQVCLTVKPDDYPSAYELELELVE